MNPYQLQELREAYAKSSAYSQRWKYPPENFIIKWPSDVYAGHLWRDTELFQESLEGPPRSRNDDLTTLIFGNQLRQERLSIRHLANLLCERALLYSRHISDINHRHLQIQEEIAREGFSSPYQSSRQKVALEKLLIDLESDKRKEQTDFWKDTKDIREVMFEKAKEYQSSSQRAQLLAGLGEAYGKF